MFSGAGFGHVGVCFFSKILRDLQKKPSLEQHETVPSEEDRHLKQGCYN